MKNIALLILSIGAMNLASFTTDESFFDEVTNVNLVEDSIMVKSKCPPTTAGCLVNSQDGELFIYIANSISKSLHDVSLFGLMFDAYQFQETGKINTLKTCRMKLAYAKNKNYLNVISSLEREC
tara:strand:+ start:1985 stop:2356 length:372 start_codon:yes stop_codon:yes gene_type:complete